MFPLKVQAEDVLLWKQFHEDMAVDAVLNNRLHDLKALIKTDWVGEIYDAYWEDMQVNLRKIQEKQTAAQERMQALTDWVVGMSSGLANQSELIKQARERSEKSLVQTFEELLGQRELKENQTQAAIQKYRKELQVTLDNAGLKLDEKEIGTDGFGAELLRLEGIISKCEEEKSTIEGLRKTIDPYFEPIARPESEHFERYFKFFRAQINLSPQVLATQVSPVFKDKTEVFVVPDPYRRAIEKLVEAQSLSELVSYGYDVPAGPLRDQESDDKKKREIETNISKLTNEVRDIATNLRAPKLKKLAEYQKEREKLVSEAVNRLHDVKNGIFKDNFCQHHFEGVSPNHVIPKSVIDNNNRRVTENKNLDADTKRKLMLAPGSTLLEAALRREYYLPATWLLMNGADAFQKNESGKTAYSFLIDTKVSGISQLATEMFQLMTRRRTGEDTPTQTALRYKMARESDYSQAQLLDNAGTNANALVPRHEFRTEASEILRKYRELLSEDQTSIARYNLPHGFWTDMLYRMNLIIRAGFITINELSDQVHDVRSAFIGLKQQLINADAVGHDELIAKHLGKLRDISLSSSGYKDLAASLTELKAHFHDASNFGRKQNDEYNLALIDTMMDTTRALASQLESYKRRAEEAEKEAENLRAQLQISIEAQNKMQQRDSEREQERGDLLERDQKREQEFEELKQEVTKNQQRLEKLEALLSGDDPVNQDTQKNQSRYSWTK